MTSTPQQRLTFQLFLIEREGFNDMADRGRRHLEGKNWLGIYDIVDHLSKPEGPLVQTDTLVPQDIIHNMRLALNELVLERLANDVNDTQPTVKPKPVEERKLPTEFVRDNEDDNLQPA